MNDQDITPFQFDSLDGKSSDVETSAISAPSVEPPDLEMIYHEELEALREKASKEGFEQGQAQGFIEGKSSGYAEGFAKGNETGYQEGLSRSSIESALLKEASEQWSHIEESVAEFLEKAVLSLSLDIARQVIRKEISLSTANDIKTHLDSIITELHLNDISVCWSMHPDQISIIESLSPELPSSWSFHADAQMSIGGLRIRAQWPDTFDVGRTVSQEWDDRLETRWSEVVSRILGGD